MCGIAGIYQLGDNGLNLDVLQRFTNSMLHRGPDGGGYQLLKDSKIGLGQRRLSILDLSDAAAQPMPYDDGSYWITYNGEVFNFEEIRKELQSMGYSFRTSSDTEVILAAYKAWGKSCLDRFNGMWAFAIWDDKKQELFLARDRFGIKPLYYLHHPGKRFVFASETRAFKFLDDYQRSINSERLNLNLEDPYALEGLGYTIFEDIFQLLPGHFMLLDSTGIPKQKRWWDIREQKVEVPESFEEQAEKFYELLKDACRIRLVSDVPIGTALSGGLDSSAVYSIVSDILKNEQLGRVNPDSQRAFTAVFPGLPDDERQFAERAVSFTNGPIVFLDSNQPDLAERINYETELSDFISVSPITAISTVYGGMRNNGVTVSLDGHGVDEMLYGYRDMVYSLYNHELWNGSKDQAAVYQKVLQSMVHPNNAQEMTLRLQKDLIDKANRESKLSYRLKRAFKSEIQNKEYLPSNLPHLSDQPYDFTHLSLEQRMVHNEFFQHTLPALLRNFDRAGMINSIEIRMPFMDWRLVTFVYSLPISSKIGQGFTKLILREAMKHKMDESLRIRTFKVGIGSPIQSLLNGPLKNWAFDSIKDSKLKETAEAVLKEKGHYNVNETRNIWQHINTELIK